MDSAGTTVTAATNTFIFAWNPGGSRNFGYLNIPINSQSGNYTLVVGDEGKCVTHPNGAGSGHTYRIPANNVVPLPLGTILTFANRDSNSLAIAANSDSLYIAGNTSPATVTMAQNGMATAVKVEPTVWIMEGIGIS